MKKILVKRLLCLSALGVGGLMVAAGTARANSVTYTDNFGLMNGNWYGNFTLPQFNSSLGTLTEVDFSVDGSVLGNATVTNTQGAPEDITTNIAANLYLKNPGGSSNIVLSSPDWTTTDSAVGAGDSVTHSYEAASDTETNSYTSSNGTKFTQFIGVGNITLPVTAKNATGASATGGGVNASLSSQSAADVVVTYDYTPATPVVPEPATMGAVLAAGAIGLGSLLRRRRTV